MVVSPSSQEEPLEPQVSEVWEAGHVQTAALGGLSDILQRNSSRNSAKTHQYNDSAVKM